MTSLKTMMKEDTSSGGFVAQMRKHNKNVVVFFGSQTGTAEEVGMLIIVLLRSC